jgi:hypothetical protein
MSAFFGRGRRIFNNSSTTSRVEQDGRAATGQPESEDPSAGHGHQQRFACAGHLLALAPLTVQAGGT